MCFASFLAFFRFTAIFQSSVIRFELGSVAWTPTGFPAGITPWTAAWQDRSKPYLTIRLKDETTSTFDSVAYSTSLENTSLQEYCRLIKRYRNVLFMTDDTIEAKHFISCFSHWLKTMDEIRGKTSFIASVEENEICTAQELVKLLREYGWYLLKFVFYYAPLICPIDRFLLELNIVSF
ncbi:uncharacterized protein LOC135695058 isoform X1 [Rhopilema esculentum]|uniref:uncharacterized protein LOC135695058 isoform X1 n=1 Tax=Rhopilema esculentum TaxID=499914 RepID=UPI0031D8CBD9